MLLVVHQILGQPEKEVQYQETTYIALDKNVNYHMRTKYDLIKIYNNNNNINNNNNNNNNNKNVL